MMRFRKMNGLGNDFAVIDLRIDGAPLAPERIRALADRSTGIGFDQFITIAPARDGSDVLMRINNADGGEVESCGNAARCVAGLIIDESGADTVSIGSAGGPMTAWRKGERVAVDMGAPRFCAADIPLASGDLDAQALWFGDPQIDRHGPAACANVGNPHVVFFVPDADEIPLDRLGPLVETHPLLPERANVSFVSIDTRTRVRARVWERGVGATKACGTAACAIAAVGHHIGRLGDLVDVLLPGGPLNIDVRGGRIVMTGPYALDWTGTITDTGFERDST